MGDVYRSKIFILCNPFAAWVLSRLLLMSLVSEVRFTKAMLIRYATGMELA